ncbi:MAG: lipopolysaccharide core heptose(II) kinase RfaY [Oligoflexus sp.]
MLRFESVLLRAQIAESASELQQIVLRDQINLTSYDLLRAQLWIYASQLKLGSEKRNSFKKMREKFPKRADNSFGTESDFRLLQFIETCYDSNIPLQQRLENLGKKLSETSLIHDPELYCIFLVASIRWLYRIKQLSFASMLIEEYRSQSLKFSDGRLLDSLGILGEVIDKLPVITDQIPSPVQLKLYTGVTPRFIAISQVIAKCLFLLAQYKITPKNSDEDAEKLRHTINIQVAKIIEECVGKLKGPLMKIIQLSGASKYLSSESRQIMRRIYDSSSPCSFEELKAHGEKDLGRTFASIFAEFDENPLAVASIGQVFRGTTKVGDSVAIKIMYPKIEKIIQSDLTIMKILIPFLRQILPNTDMNQIWGQLVNRFQKECDYQIEMENQLAFYNIFNHHPYIKIPKIYQEFCSQRVFVSEFIEGERLDEYLENASQEQRNHIAEQILRFHVEAIFVHGLWHIDPHPGNFIVSEDRLVVLDFGAIFRTNSIATDFQRVRTLCSMNNDCQGFYDKISELNLINRDVLSFDLFQKELSYHFFSPFHVDEVRPYFYEYDTRNTGDVVVKRGLSHAFLFKAEDLFPFTVQQYIGELLNSTGAILNWHQLLQSIVKEITPHLEASSQ